MVVVYFAARAAGGADGLEAVPAAGLDASALAAASFLGTQDDGQAWFALPAAAWSAPPPGLGWTGLREAADGGPGGPEPALQAQFPPKCPGANPLAPAGRRG